MRTPSPDISADSFFRPAWHHPAGRNWRDVVLCPHIRLDYKEAKALVAVMPSLYCEQCHEWLPDLLLRISEPKPEQLSLDIDIDPAPF